LPLSPFFLIFSAIDAQKGGLNLLLDTISNGALLQKRREILTWLYYGWPLYPSVGQKWWPTYLRIKIPFSQWGDEACPLEIEDFFLVGRGGEGFVSVFFSILGSGWLFVSEWQFCFGLVCKVVVEIQKKFYFFSLAWVGHMDKAL
jgi:hypothetical protein